MPVTSSQIQCFLAAVETMSFTQAAQRMYLSQPGLSRQICALEQELGLKLFTRGRNTIKLTEAGKICADCFSRMKDDYHKMMQSALIAQQKQDSTLVIGCFEGQMISKSYSDVLLYFWTQKPNTTVQISYFTQSGLNRALLSGEVDLAFMPEGEASLLPDVEYKPARKDRCCLVVSKEHPNAGKPNPTLADFKDETFLVVSENDSSAVARQHLRVIESSGFELKHRTVPTFGTLAMMLQMGVGISVMNEWHSLRDTPELKFLHIPEIGYRVEAVVWRRDNNNPNVPLFIEKMEEPDGANSDN